MDTTARSEVLAAPESSAGSVRAFQRADIPAVVALRQELFTKSEHGSAAALESYMDELFFQSPHMDASLPSLVFEDEYGALCGFVGVVPRRMLFGARTLRVAVATQFMVSARCRGLAGRKLARAVITGPQDITIADAANDAARTFWASVGGRTSLAHSLQWTCALRPARYAAMGAVRGGAFTRALAFAARPILALIDGAVEPRSRGPSPLLSEIHDEPLDTAQHHPALNEILERWTLRPRYDPESLAWVIHEASLKRRLGSLQGVLVRNSRREAIGWFLYCLNRGGVSTVVQFAAVKAAGERVLARMIDHARRRGAVALSGRFDPAMVQELSGAGSFMKREGPWMLYHSRHQGVEGAIESGNAFLSRLDGEWWMRF